MIEIDLLPPELSEAHKISLPQLVNKKLLVILVGCLIAVHFLFNFLLFLNNKRLNILQAKWQKLSGQDSELGQFKSELSRVNAEVPLIEELINNRILWSKKLNEISDLLAEGIWLTELSLEEREASKGKMDEYLIIRGSAVSRTREQPALIAKTMQNLKNDSSFQADFMEIELGPIKKRLVKETEVMDFVLICKFKEDKAQALLR